MHLTLLFISHITCYFFVIYLFLHGELSEPKVAGDLLEEGDNHG